MKKLSGVALVVLLLAIAASASVHKMFNFSANVPKYIEFNAGLNTNVGPINVPIPQGVVTPSPFPMNDMGWMELGYANCPFTLQATGNNAVPDGLPILAQYEPHPFPFGWDRLQTRIDLEIRINGLDPCTYDWTTTFQSNPQGANTGTWTWQTQNCPIPHDGEIWGKFFFGAALPNKSPDYGPDNTWNQSADFGTYTCTYTIILTAI